VAVAPTFSPSNVRSARRRDLSAEHGQPDRFPRTSQLRGIIRMAGAAGLLAAVLAAGCSAGAPVPYRASVGTCYAFGVQAIRARMLVTTVPRACAGLSHEQVNLAVARAVRETAGSRPKAAARRRADTDGAYLGRLVTAVAPARRVPLAVGPAPPAMAISASLAALAAWILTAAAGSYLLAGWLADGRLRHRAVQADRLPPAVVVSHFVLAVGGLGIWIAFVVTSVPALAWMAVGSILLVAGLGMAALVGALPEPARIAEPASSPRAPATRAAETAIPARAATSVLVIAVHGVLAAATVLLVLVAAISAA
jgi:manganese efflux pump family protein